MTEATSELFMPRINLPLREIDFDRENAECGCITSDLPAFRSRMELTDVHQHLASFAPVFVKDQVIAQIHEAVGAISNVFSLPAWQQHVLEDAPEITYQPSGPRGVLMGYDFHLTETGPKLIEVNTNAGGALIASGLLASQQACCSLVEQTVTGFQDHHHVPELLFQSFMKDWVHAGRIGQPEYIIIIDDQPKEQYLYPELLLYQALFRGKGIEATIVSPEALSFHGGRLFHGNRQVDLVYNRLTDFYLEEPAALPLQQAYQTDSAVITPNPSHHAFMANKKNLVTLANHALLEVWGVEAAVREMLRKSIPHCQLLTDENAEDLWASRRNLFFKPVAGYGSRGTYRGGKITRRVWEEILASDYIAQEYCPPSVSPVKIGDTVQEQKVDIRAYVYDGNVQLLAARRYQGQTTNMRTPGGGFAPVYAVGE